MLLGPPQAALHTSGHRRNLFWGRPFRTARHGGLPLSSKARRTIYLRPAKFKSRESVGKATALAGWGREGERGPPYPTTSEKILNSGASRWNAVRSGGPRPWPQGEKEFTICGPRGGPAPDAHLGLHDGRYCQVQPRL